MKILLADDDRQYCLIFKKYLQKKGDHQISLAFDGNDTKHYLEKDIYDVVFLDCDMPHIPGVDLIRMAKKENPEAAIIMISGYKGIDENFAKRVGVDEFLKKPFPIKRIDKILKKYGRRK